MKTYTDQEQRMNVNKTDAEHAGERYAAAYKQATALLLTNATTEERHTLARQLLLSMDLARVARQIDWLGVFGAG